MFYFIFQLKNNNADVVSLGVENVSEKDYLQHGHRVLGALPRREVVRSGFHVGLSDFFSFLLNS